MSDMSPLPRPNPQTTKGRATRARILAAATDLYSRGGHAGVAVGPVCDIAGMKRASFYSYFTGADVLADTVRDAAILRVGQVMTDPLVEPGSRRMRRFLADMLYLVFRNPETGRLVAMLWRETPEIRTVLTATLRADLRAMGKAGADMDAKVLAASLIGVMEAMIRAEMGVMEMDEAVDRLMGMVG